MAQRREAIVFMVTGVLLVSGCRAATRMAEKPRVDLELAEGNRGYLVGTPPESADVKTTRQMVETDVEIPSMYKPKRGGVRVSPEALAPSEPEPSEAAEGAGVSAAPAGSYDTYVVQKSDTSLWSIAAKPEIYGKATKWRRIYEANRDVLKSPERLRAGMVLKIPRGEEPKTPSTTYSDQGITNKK